MKIPWNDYFLTLAYLVSQRSIDPSTKIGCVITDSENTILSVGYNSPPRGCVDELMPLERDLGPDEPNKYMVFCHAEEAAIANAARNGVPLKGSTFYITGSPCEKCLRLIINSGAKKIIHGPVSPKCCINKGSKKAIELMMFNRKDFSIESLNSKQDFIDILNTTINYINSKD
jgi:dCMP deaminase